MTWPVSDGVFLFLLAIRDGVPVDAADGSLTLSGVPVPTTALDAIEARGWLRVEEAGPVVTEVGKDWLRRWSRARLGRDVRVTRVGAA